MNTNRISRLPPGLRELAVKRMAQFPQKQLGNFNPDCVYHIEWAPTPEGYAFWQEVNSGRYRRYYGCTYKVKSWK